MRSGFFGSLLSTLTGSLRGAAVELANIGRLAASLWVEALIFYAVVVGMLAAGYIVAASFSATAALAVLIFGLVFVAAFGLFSDGAAAWLRRHEDLWLRGREKPGFRLRVLHLPEAITVLCFPLYFLNMAAVFWATGTHFPELLSVRSWADPVLVAVDNLLRSQPFFDLAEIFRAPEFGPRPQGSTGRGLLFVSRLLMDIAFLKVFLRIAVRAAGYRPRQRGQAPDDDRGMDRLWLIQHSLHLADVTDDRDTDADHTDQIRTRCQSVATTLHEAVDRLFEHWQRGGESRKAALSSMAQMGGWGQPEANYAMIHLANRLQSAQPEERRQIAELRSELGERLTQRDERRDGYGGSARRWPWLVAAYGCLLLGVLSPFFVSGMSVLLIAGPLLIVVAGLLMARRHVLAWLVDHEILPALRPKAAQGLDLAWIVALLPLLFLGAAHSFSEIEHLDPGALERVAHAPAHTEPAGEPPRETGFSDAALLAVENLLRIQLLADLFEIYEVKWAPVEAAGRLSSCPVTLLTRLSIDLSIIALLLNIGKHWFHRVFHGFTVPPNALSHLANAATDGGIHAVKLIGAYYADVEEFFFTNIKDQLHKDPRLAAALADSGFLEIYQKTVDEDLEAARAHYQLARHLSGHEEGPRHAASGEHLSEARFEVRRARQIYERLLQDGDRNVQQALIAVVHLETEILEALELPEVELEKQARYVVGILAWMDQSAPDARFRRDLAAAHLRLGESLGHQRKLHQATAELRKAIELFEQEGGPKEWSLQLLHARCALAHVLRTEGHRQAALREYRAAVEGYEHLAGVAGADALVELATAYHNYALLLTEDGQARAALPPHRKAMELLEQRVVIEGEDRLNVRLAKFRCHYGRSLDIAGRLEEAEREIRIGVDTLNGLLATNLHPDAWDDLADGYRELALLREEQDDLQSAIEYASRAVAQYRWILERRKSTHVEIGLAYCCDRLAVLLRCRGELEPSLERQQEAQQIYGRLSSAGRESLSDDYARSCVNAALASWQAGNDAAAEAQLREAEPALRRAIASVRTAGRRPEAVWPRLLRRVGTAFDARAVLLWQARTASHFEKLAEDYRIELGRLDDQAEPEHDRLLGFVWQSRRPLTCLWTRPLESGRRSAAMPPLLLVPLVSSRPPLRGVVEVLLRHPIPQEHQRQLGSLLARCLGRSPRAASPRDERTAEVPT